MMEQAFRLIDDPNGESTYLRLSTRAIAQVERDGRQLARGRAAGRLLAARARRGRRSGDRRDGRGHARSARRLGGAAATTFRASACSPSRRPTCSTAAGPPRRRRAGRASAGRATSSNCCRALAATPAWSPSPTPRPPRCRGSAACSGSASRRSASRSSARPAASPISMPPTGSTAPRSPKALPSCCLPA